MNFVASVVEFCGDLKMNLLELSNIVRDKASFVQCLQQRGSLHNPGICGSDRVRQGSSFGHLLKQKYDVT